MNLFPYKWLIVLMTFPVFASAAGNWVTLKNGSPPDSYELKVDNEQCKNKAAIKFPLVNAMKGQTPPSEQNDQDETLIRLGQQLREQLQAAQDAQRVIHEKESARIGNPFGWLTSQLTLEEDYRKYNQAVEAANLTAQNITALTKAAEAIQSTQAGRSLGQKSIDSPRSAGTGEYASPTEITQDDNVDRRFQHYYACMTALGYKRVFVQDPSRPYIWQEK